MNLGAFAYPDAYTVGTAARNQYAAPGLSWPQASLSKQFQVKERIRFLVRWDICNPFKAVNFAAPNSTFDTRNPESFGRITQVRGGGSELGGRLQHILVGRVEW